MGLGSFIRKCIYVAAIAVSASAATAQTFPDHPIRVIIPYAPGGGTDILFRIIAPEAGTILGQTIIVDNRPGSSTMVGTGAVARGTADGYTLLATDSALLINPGLFKNQLTYDTLKQFKGITMMATSPALLVIHPKVQANNLTELISLAKSKPGALNYGSGGIGTAPNLAGELMKLSAGIDVQHIPFKGTGPALTAVLGGQIDMAFLGISSAAQYIAAGQLRAIAVTGQSRNPSLPDVPTFHENKLAVEGSSFWGIYAPTDVPEPIVAKLNAAFVKALRSPETRKKLDELGFSVIGNTPEEHTAQLRDMINYWISVVDRTGIKIEQ